MPYDESLGVLVDAATDPNYTSVTGDVQTNAVDTSVNPDNNADVENQVRTQEGEYTYTPPTDTELQEWAGQIASGNFDWQKLINAAIRGGLSGATGRGGGMSSIPGLFGGMLALKGLYDRFKGQESKAEALRDQAAYTPAPLYARQLQSPIYGRGGIGEALYFNPNPFQFDPAQARAQSNMAVPEDTSRPKPTLPEYTAIPTRPTTATQPQYVSDLLSKFQSPVTLGPTAPAPAATSALPTMASSMSPYTVTRAMGGPIYDEPDESLDYARGGLGGTQYARGGIAGMLRGAGDGMSDHIPATIQGKQPARLSDGEFVIPADVVSHLGNGSSTAGAERLYEMMDKVRKSRTGKTDQAPKINPNKHLPR